MIAFKFLAEGAVGPFTGFRWPRPEGGDPAPWVAAERGAGDERWVHACRIDDLPYWLGAELWRVELDGPVVDAPHQVACPRARLVEQVPGWSPAVAAEFALECALRARDLAARRLPSAARQALLAASDAASLERATAALSASDAGAAYVNTAAVYAGRGAPSVAGFVAEMCARALEGDDAGVREREQQARWLAERLKLGVH